MRGRGTRGDDVRAANEYLFGRGGRRVGRQFGHDARQGAILRLQALVLRLELLQLLERVSPPHRSINQSISDRRHVDIISLSQVPRRALHHRITSHPGSRKNLSPFAVTIRLGDELDLGITINLISTS